MKYRTPILFLATAFICGGVLVYHISQNSDKALTEADSRELQLLALYQDGSCQVYSYENEDEMESGAKALQENEKIVLVQPNYEYTNNAVVVSDALAGEQWALSNDGTFSMEEEQNRYPVFDRPFGQPSAPGHWQRPDQEMYQNMPDGMNPSIGRGVGENENRQNQNARGLFRQAFHGIPGRNVTYSAAATSVTNAVAGIDVNVEEAWSLYGEGSREVVIALIDTGVEITHEDLSGAIWTNSGEIAGNGIDDDGNGYIDDIYGWNFHANNNQVFTGSDDDHGTHGAGTISAAADNNIGIAGIIPGDKVKLMVLKVLGGSDGSGDTASLIKAIQYAEANGASICNLSLSTTSFDQALYQTMAQSNMLFIAAAGNGNERTGLGQNLDLAPCYPAAFDLPNIISVANLSYDGTLHSSSNYGTSSVDLAAPGTYILSTTTEDGYSYMTGTSMAAPMVTAAAAMVYSYNWNLSLQQVKDILLASTTSLDSLEGITVSGGMLNIGNALAVSAGY